MRQRGEILMGPDQPGRYGPGGDFKFGRVVRLPSQTKSFALHMREGEDIGIADLHE